MSTGHLHVRGLLLALAAAPAVACSLWLSLEEEGRPCSASGQCLAGYNCIEQKCMPSGSVPLGGACEDRELCADGLLCADRVCRATCRSIYAASGECGYQSICAPTQTPHGQLVAACVTGTCDEQSCREGGAHDVGCVEVAESARVCLERCTVACSGDTCDDTCPQAPSGTPSYCQPVGSKAAPVCLPAGNSRHGDTCDLLDSPCARGHACIQPPGESSGLCLAYCAAAAVGACAGLTDPASGLPATCNPVAGFAVCGHYTAEPKTATGVGDDTMHCAETCAADTDCRSDHRCDSGRCRPAQCTADVECHAAASGWTVACSQNSGCGDGEVCVDVSPGPDLRHLGRGLCAVAASDEASCLPMGQRLATFEHRHRGDGGSVAVCAATGYRCHAGDCLRACEDDLDCASRPGGGSMPQCNATTGRCQCRSDLDCVKDDSGFSRCSMGACVCQVDAECYPRGFSTCELGTCLCGNDRQCAGRAAGDRCLGAAGCGCFTASDCGGTRIHPGTVWECVAE